MSIERQLRQAYDRAASSEPSEAGAYDRFLRRRARRDRAVAIATSIAVVVLAAAALVPRVLAERQPTAEGAPASAQERGHQARSGIRADDPRRLEAQRAGRPTRPAAGPDTAVHDEAAYDDHGAHRRAGPADLPGATSLPGLRFPTADLRPPRSGRAVHRGRRADGRWFVRSDHANQLAGAWQQRYQLAWPYQCAKGARCPREAGYRGLLVEAASLRSEGAATRVALRQVVETVRPSATPSTGPSRSPPGAPAGSPASGTPPPISSCRLPTSKPRDGREVGLEVEFKISSSLVSCRLRQRVTLQLWEGGRLAKVADNGSTVEFDGVPARGVGRLRLDRRGLAVAELVRQPRRDRPLRRAPWLGAPAVAARCLDPTRPSTLERAAWPR